MNALIHGAFSSSSQPYICVSSFCASNFIVSRESVQKVFPSSFEYFHDKDLIYMQIIDNSSRDDDRPESAW